MNILFLLLFFTQKIISIPQEAQYFLDAKKLYNIQQTQEELFKLGFKKIFFTTQDNIKLCGLFLDKSKKEKIKGTILYCAGFYPGLKEGMCSFYSLLINQPYNILIFDARGHNESDGSFLSYEGIKKYGQKEYLDIVAALQYIYNYNQENNITQNIIIHGICSGAFHSIKALNYLIENNSAQADNIKGIIFDSGWFHLSDIVKSSIYSDVSKHLKNSYFSWATTFLSYMLYQIYNLLFSKEHSAQEGIHESIQKIKCPIFFVHCTNDPYVPIKPVQDYTQKCNCKYFWWIPHNSHANYHMHNYQHYQDKLLDFLNSIY